jgi:hypothetical protein
VVGEDLEQQLLRDLEPRRVGRKCGKESGQDRLGYMLARD